jgi:hypothetical protein
MKEIYFITAYTPTFDKEQALRNLVHSIKQQGKEILVISHSPIAKDIENMCDYTIFDKENKLVFDSNSQYWSTSKLNDVIFEYVNLESFITILAVYKLFLGGLAYLKSLDYDIVHFLEYDCEIKDFTHFKNVTKSLVDNEYDMFGCYDKDEFTDTYLTLPISCNLKKLTFDQLIYNEKKLVSEYKDRFSREHYPITETINYDMVWKNLNKKVFHENELKDTIITNFNNIFGQPDRLSFNLVDGMLHFLHDNITKTDGNTIDIIVRDINGIGTSKSFIVPYIRCVWVNLGVEYSKVFDIKIYKNGSFYKHLDMRKPNDRFYVESSKIIRL